MDSVNDDTFHVTISLEECEHYQHHAVQLLKGSSYFLYLHWPIVQG